MIRKYWAILKTQLINSLAYPGDLFSRSLSIVFFMWVFVHLWRATYRSTGQEAIAGLTLRHTLWYLMLAETIVLSRPRLTATIAEAVWEGSVAYLLNKPYNFLLYQLSVGFGDSLLRMVFNALAGGAIVWLTVGPPPDPRGFGVSSVERWPLTLVAIAAAWLIDFCITAMIGLAAFVTEEVSAFEWIYSKALFLLGGLLIPLDFFPDWLRAVTQALPFAYTVYGPARLFVEPSLGRFATLLLAQAAWLAALGLLLTFLYRKGVTWLTINGG
jgi:ABC-2 type transport system permease protein